MTSCPSCDYLAGHAQGCPEIAKEKACPLVPPSTPAEKSIALALQMLGIFFESVSCGWFSARAEVVLLREEDATETACYFSQAGWAVQAEGRRVIAWVGVA